MLAHGTRKKYNIDKCRCDLCRKAISSYNAQRQRLRYKKQPYLPLQPVWDLMPQEWRNNHGEFYRNNIEKGLRLYKADRMCVKLGLHPWSVYGDLWFQSEWETYEQE